MNDEEVYLHSVYFSSQLYLPFFFSDLMGVMTNKVPKDVFPRNDNLPENGMNE